jgi:hypothetical protein
MSREVIGWARTIDGLTISAKSVLNTLAEYADNTGRCFPCERTIARATCMSGRHVRRQIQRLEELGLLERSAHFSTTSGAQTSNRYQLLIFNAKSNLSGSAVEADASDNAQRSPSPPDRRGRPAGQLSPGDRTPTKAVCSREQTLLANGVREPVADERAVWFERAFAEWKLVSPARLSRPKAWRRWKSVCIAVTPKDLFEAVKRYLQEDPDIRRLGYARGMEPWLTDENYEAWLRQPASGKRPVARFEGPETVRSYAAARFGQGWVASWLDPCSWDGQKNLVFATSNLARDRLIQELHPCLTALRIRVVASRLRPGGEGG